MYALIARLKPKIDHKDLLTIAAPLRESSMIPWGMTFTMSRLGLENVRRVAIPTFFVAVAAISSAMALRSTDVLLVLNYSRSVNR